MEPNTEKKLGLLQLEGATCMSCIYTIEHVGRKIPGVDDVFVDRTSGHIQVEYDGADGSLEKIQEVVATLGYKAEVVQRA